MVPNKRHIGEYTVYHRLGQELIRSRRVHQPASNIARLTKMHGYSRGNLAFFKVLPREVWDRIMPRHERSFSWQRFQKRNLSQRLVSLDMMQHQQGAQVLAPFCIADGGLQPVEYGIHKGVVRTGIRVDAWLGDADLSDLTRLAKAIIRHNWIFQDGLAVFFLQLTQLEDVNGVPQVRYDLDVADSDDLSGRECGFTYFVENGYLCLRLKEVPGAIDRGFAAVLVTPEGVTSTQSIALEDGSYFRNYQLQR